MKNFAHLHLNTEYSFGNSIVGVDELFAECERRDIVAVAITDRNCLFGAVEFIKAAAKHSDCMSGYMEFLEEKRPFKVKPIIGCELTFGSGAQNATLMLLCKNREGYLNLVKLVSEMSVNSTSDELHIEYEQIERYHAGLICIGVLSEALEEKLEDFKNMFGEDFYLELTSHNSEACAETIKLAGEYDIKTVATNDVRYIDSEDDWAYRAYVAGRASKTISPERTKGEYYLKSYDEMAAALPEYAEAIDRALEIADKCDPYVICNENLMPRYTCPDGLNSAQYLRQLVEEGLIKRYGVVTPELRKRVEYEFNLITERGFADYFLVVWDYVNFAEHNSIPVGPGRGAAVASIVCYALGITKVEPIKYGLLSERFMNPDRIFIPDIDIDFCVERRNEVIDYIIQKYGAENVVGISTISRSNIKTVIRRATRILGLLPHKADEIISHIRQVRRGVTIAMMLGKELYYGTDISIPFLVDIYNRRPEIKDILDLAQILSKLVSYRSTHAAGNIIASAAVGDYIPLTKTNEGVVVTQYDMDTLEELGAVKFDFLGLVSLTHIKNSCKLIKILKDREINFDTLDYADSEVYDLISAGDTNDIFQFESSGMKRFLRDMKPTCMEDIIAAISLYRPGTMDNIPAFIEGKHNIKSIKCLHPKMADALSVTYGVLIYQEQLMRLLHDLAGYSYAEADILRRTMAKKKHDLLYKERPIFIERCGKNGIASDVAEEIFDMLIERSGYLFNKSHAAAYAHITYWCAYLKKHYPTEFNEAFEYGN